MNARKTHLIITLIIVCLGVYFNALFNGFVYDDRFQVLENRWITDAGYIPEIFTKHVWGFSADAAVSNYYRPLMHVTYMINHYIFGFAPWGFHLTNILFHAGVSIMVFLLTERLLRECSNRENDKIMAEGLSPRMSGWGFISPPFIAALIFAVHPIHTEAVTWVAGLPDLGFTFFYLLSFYLYIRSEKTFDRRYLFSVASFFIATLFKEPALTLPIILIGYDYAAQRTSNSYKTYIRKYAPYFAVAGIYFILRLNALENFAPRNQHPELSPYQYVINVFPLFMQYLWKLLIPVNLNAYHVLHPISSIFEIEGILSLMITAAFIALIFVSLLKRDITREMKSSLWADRFLFLSLLFIIIPLLPALYIPGVGENTFAERYLYLPSFGFVLLTAWLLLRIKAANSQFASGLAIFLLVVTVFYSAAVVSRNGVWKNDLTLFADIAAKSPDAAKMRNNLGLAYLRQNRISDSINEFIAALEIEPGSATIHNNLGTAYLNSDRLIEAAKEFIAALRFKPDYPQARYNLGITYAKENRFFEAEEQYIAALRLKPDYPEAHYNLGIIYAEQNSFDRAANEFLAALRLRPDYSDARYNLELSLKKLKDMEGQR